MDALDERITVVPVVQKLVSDCLIQPRPAKALVVRTGSVSIGAGVDDVASRLKPLLDDSSAGEAVRILNEDFREHDGVGPRRVAEFLMGTPDDEIQADVVGFVRQLLDRCV